MIYARSSELVFACWGMGHTLNLHLFLLSLAYVVWRWPLADVCAFWVPLWWVCLFVCLTVWLRDGAWARQEAIELMGRIQDIFPQHIQIGHFQNSAVNNVWILMVRNNVGTYGILWPDENKMTHLNISLTSGTSLIPNRKRGRSRPASVGVREGWRGRARRRHEKKLSWIFEEVTCRQIKGHLTPRRIYLIISDH